MTFQDTYMEQLKEHVLTATHARSGLRIVILPKPGYVKSYATFSTKYGSINTQFVVPGETETTTVIDGVAHFLEHKVFEQPDGSDAFQSFAKYGGSANAFTSFGVTNYLFSATENFYENLAVLLDYVQKPYFTKENVEKEKGIIAQEVRMYDDDPSQRVFYNCLRGLYREHPVRVEIAGSVDEIMKTTPEILYKCYNTFYHPSNMALICVGDVDPERVGKMVEEMVLRDKPEQDIVQVFPNEPKEIASARMEAKMDVPMPMMMLGFKDNDCGGTGEELLRREILSDAALHLLFGASSPLYRELYDKGLINGSFGAYYDYETSFGFAAICGDTPDPDAVNEAVHAEVARVLREGIDEAAFVRTQKMLYGRMLRTLNSVEHLGNAYMFAFHRGVNQLDYPRLCMEMTKDAVEARIAQLLVRDAACLSVILPS